MLPADDPDTIWVADDQGQEAENLGSALDVLIAEFRGRLAAAIVTEQVVLACHQLLTAGVLAGLGSTTASLARARLRALAAPAGVQ